MDHVGRNRLLGSLRLHGLRGDRGWCYRHRGPLGHHARDRRSRPRCDRTRRRSRRLLRHRPRSGLLSRAALWIESIGIANARSRRLSCRIRYSHLVSVSCSTVHHRSRLWGRCRVNRRWCDGSRRGGNRSRHHHPRRGRSRRLGHRPRRNHTRRRWRRTYSCPGRRLRRRRRLSLLGLRRRRRLLSLGRRRRGLLRLRVVRLPFLVLGIRLRLPLILISPALSSLGKAQSRQKC